jgi:hypothetical protein
LNEKALQCPTQLVFAGDCAALSLLHWAKNTALSALEPTACANNLDKNTHCAFVGKRKFAIMKSIVFNLAFSTLDVDGYEKFKKNSATNLDVIV